MLRIIIVQVCGCRFYRQDSKPGIIVIVPKVKIKLLLNWPIQSHGAEVLRRAIINLTDEFFEICTTVHDAVLIQIPIPDFKSRVNLAKEIMVRSSIEVIGGPIRVDHETITGNFIQAPEDQIFFDEIMKEIEIYKGTPVLGDGVHPNREHPPILL